MISPVQNNFKWYYRPGILAQLSVLERMLLVIDEKGLSGDRSQWEQASLWLESPAQIKERQ